MNPLNEKVAVDLCRCFFVAKISSEAKTLFVAPETSSLVEPLSVPKTLFVADSLFVSKTLLTFWGNKKLFLKPEMRFESLRDTVSDG